MGKDLAMIHKSYKTWLCNAALFALICAAFAAGVLLGPLLTLRGKDELKTLHCSPDGDKTSQFSNNAPRGSKSECISREQLEDFMKQWSRTLGDLIEDKMLNATKRKLNSAIRKFSKDRDVQTQGKIEDVREKNTCKTKREIDSDRLSLTKNLRIPKKLCRLKN